MVIGLQTCLRQQVPPRTLDISSRTTRGHMKSIYESLRQKELELQRAWDDAAEVNERELRRIQKLLQDALGAVNQLIGSSAATAEVVSPISTTTITPIESKSVERINLPSSDPKKVMHSSQAAIAACFSDPSAGGFP